MPLHELLKTGLFGLLAAPSLKVTNEGMQNAYKVFTDPLTAIGSSEIYSHVFR